MAAAAGVASTVTTQVDASAIRATAAAAARERRPPEPSAHARCETDSTTADTNTATTTAFGHRSPVDVESESSPRHPSVSTVSAHSEWSLSALCAVRPLRDTTTPPQPARLVDDDNNSAIGAIVVAMATNPDDQRRHPDVQPGRPMAGRSPRALDADAGLRRLRGRGRLRRIHGRHDEFLTDVNVPFDLIFETQDERRACRRPEPWRRTGARTDRRLPGRRHRRHPVADRTSPSLARREP